MRVELRWHSVWLWSHWSPTQSNIMFEYIKLVLIWFADLLSKVTTLVWCLSHLHFMFLLLFLLSFKTFYSIFTLVIHKTYSSVYSCTGWTFLAFRLKDSCMYCWYQVAISRYMEVGHLCYCIYTCSIFPLHLVTTVRPNKIKALVEMGHPLTSCVSVECMLRAGHASWHQSACACVYMSCQAVVVLCVWEGVCVLECGLTFNFDTTSDIRSHHKRNYNI